jgi:ribose/xylose/arabinose/galactoside ABC-type transport system permease subunit
MTALTETEALSATERRLRRVERLFKLWETAGLLVVLVIVGAIVSLATPSFLTDTNLVNIAISSAIIAVTGLGMTLVIAMGQFDLSVGSVQGLTAIVAASLLGAVSLPLAIVATLLLGLAIGLVNGLIITRLRVPAFVATLAMLSIARGAALLVCNGQSILIQGHDNYTLINTARLAGIPVPFIVALAVLALGYLLLNRTPFGRHACAVGGNPLAAVAAGLRIDRTVVIVFGLVGFTAALSGILISAQLMIVDGGLGTGFELQAIAVSVLGGTSLKGGSGNLVGTFFAAMLLSTINSSLNLLNVPSFYQFMAVGLLLILALSVDTLRRYLISTIQAA